MKRSFLGRTLLVGACAMAAISARNADAAVLFADSFNRPDSRDIDAVNTGVTNNTGTSFGASAIYTSPWVDPATVAPSFGTPDTVPANGGGQQILNNELQKYNPGTANLFVNHNFVNSSILAAGGFTVSLDVMSVSQTTKDQGAAIALGMSLAEAQAGHDAYDGNPAPIAKYTNAFQPAGAFGGTILSDFYVALRANKTVAWGSGAGAIQVATVAANTGTVSASFSFGSFAAGSTVNYTVSYNNTQVGSGTFAWSGTNENYIGLDARDSTLVRMDNFSVTIVPEPATTALALAALAMTLAGRRGSASFRF